MVITAHFVNGPQDGHIRALEEADIAVRFVALKYPILGAVSRDQDEFVKLEYHLYLRRKDGIKLGDMTHYEYLYAGIDENYRSAVDVQPS
jgi:hypothetical protein